MTEPVRTAIVGAGRMGRVHLDAVSDLGDLEVAAIVDPRPGALTALAGLLPGAARVADLGMVLGDVEAVIIAASTPAHPALVTAALAAGRHVLVEKPLTLDVGVSRDLGRRADEAGLVLQVGLWRRFSPPWRVAWKLLRGGDIGRPVYLRLAQWDATPPPSEFCDPRVSGGLAVDCGVHEYDLAEWLTGSRVTAVTAWELPVVDSGVSAVGDVDNLLAVLELERGLKVTVDLSRNARYGDDVRSEILASEGAVFVEVLPVGRAVLGTASGLTEQVEGRCDDAMVAGVAGQARAFVRAVRSGGGDVPGAEESARAVEIGQIVAESARRRVTLEVPAPGA